MNKKIITILLPSLIFSSLEAKENLVWMGYNQNSLDFFGDGISEIKPDGVLMGFSKELNDDFIVSLSYGDFQGDVTSVFFENNNISLENTAETESTSIGISLSWLSDDYGLTVSYNQLDTNENSVTRFPLTTEEIDADDQAVSFSYDSFIDMDSWDFGWSIGAQYYQSEINNYSLIETVPAIELEATFDTESVSAFIDLDFSITIEADNMEITPKFTLSWSSELSSSGDELLTISREGVRRTINQLSDRLATNFRTPDSGIWEIGLGIEWSSGWAASAAYGQSFAADTDVDSLSFDVSVSF